MNDTTTAVRKYRTIWISDLHLGSAGCKAQSILNFLRTTDSDYLYLVGDIFDFWAMQRYVYWPQLHNDVVQKLLGKVRKGTRTVYVPGNHDEMARAYVGYQFGGIDCVMNTVHTTADGRELLITHGDEFDSVIQGARWLAFLGDRAYGLALRLNTWLNIARRRLGLPYWSFSSYLKRQVKEAVKYISRFEEAVAQEAKRRGVQGVVCGHIHHAEIREIDGILYCNDGDWVESCTALVEEYGGTLHIVKIAVH